MGPVPRWLEIALARSTVTRAARMAAVVGTLLIAINHGGAVLAGQVSAGEWIRMGATMVVPYLVSTVSVVQATMDSAKGKRRPTASR